MDSTTDDWDGEKAAARMARLYPDLDGPSCHDSIHQAVGLADEELWAMAKAMGLAPCQQRFGAALDYAALALREHSGRSLEVLLKERNAFREASEVEGVEMGPGEGWARLGPPSRWSKAAIENAHAGACAVDPRRWVACLRTRSDAQEVLAGMRRAQPWGLIRAGDPEAAELLGPALGWDRALGAIAKGDADAARQASMEVARWRREIKPAGHWLSQALDKDLSQALRQRVVAKRALRDALEAAACLGACGGLGAVLYAKDLLSGGAPFGLAWRFAKGMAQSERQEEARVEPNVALTCLAAGTADDIEAAASLGWIEPFRFMDAKGMESSVPPIRHALGWIGFDADAALAKLQALGRAGFPLSGDLDDDDPGDQRWRGELARHFRDFPRLAALDQAQQMEAVAGEAQGAPSRGPRRDFERR